MLARRSAARGLLAAICVLSIISWAPQSTASSARAADTGGDRTRCRRHAAGELHSRRDAYPGWGDLCGLLPMPCLARCKPPGAVM